MSTKYGCQTIHPVPSCPVPSRHVPHLLVTPGDLGGWDGTGWDSHLVGVPKDIVIKNRFCQNRLHQNRLHQIDFPDPAPKTRTKCNNVRATAILMGEHQGQSTGAV
jgi:hypothetical protein